MKAAFELGRLSGAPFVTNAEVLRAMADAIAIAAPAERVGVAVCCHGVRARATHAYVMGWRPSDHDPDQSAPDADAPGKRWIDDPALAAALHARARGRVYRRSELLNTGNDAAAGRCADDAGDQAACLFTRSDGVDLLLALGTGDAATCEPISDRTLASFQKVAPVAAEVWAARWRQEPAWVGALKPQGRRILELVLSGFDDEQIAERTGLTYHSVRAHLKRLFREAEVRSRLHLMQACRESAPSYHALVVSVSSCQPTGAVCIG